MKKNVVIRIDGQPTVTVNPELESELLPLTPEELKYLKQSVKRDGIQDAIKYWCNPHTKDREIIDGHNRYRLAQELGLTFDVLEIVFETDSVTAVKYWMHRNQAGRRGGNGQLKRMVELYQQLQIEAGKRASKTAAVKQVAEDADCSESNVWKANAEPDEKPDVPPRPKPSNLDKIIRLLSLLTTDERETLITHLTSQ